MQHVKLTGADYVSELKYRAWGSLKSMTYASGAQTLLSYTNRLQQSNYKLTSSRVYLPSPSMDINYSYTADGRMRLSTDHKDATLDRAYSYDNLGRLTSAFTASEARSWVQSGGQTYGSTVDGPYRQTFALDAWDNTTQKFGRSFTSPNVINQVVNHTYDSASGRVSGWSYDADGRFVDESASPTSERKYYDEAGLLRSSGLYDSYNIFDYDGDGQKAKSLTALTNCYLLRSSVIGQTVSEIMTINGTKFNGFVYADGGLVAIQSTGQVYWQHRDVSGKSVRTTDASQNETGRDELDPSGVKVDGPGQDHHSGGSGGGGHDPGGAQARIASLMNLKMVDVGGILVPYAVAGSVQQHLGSMSARMQDHWNGITTWDVTVTATWGTYRTAIWTFRNLRAGLSAFKNSERKDKDKEMGIEGFTALNALRIASGLEPEYPHASGPPTLKNAQAAGFKKWEQGAVDDALKVASELSSKTKCDGALSTLSKGKITSLRSLVSRYISTGAGQNIFNGRNVSAGKYGKDNETVPAFVLGAGTSNALTYLNSKFFNFTTFAANARAIILLHEAVHHFGGMQDVDFDPSSRNKDQEVGSRNISDALIDNCTPGLKSIFNGLRL